MILPCAIFEITKSYNPSLGAFWIEILVFITVMVSTVMVIIAFVAPYFCS